MNGDRDISFHMVRRGDDGGFGRQLILQEAKISAPPRKGGWNTKNRNGV
jgi:hypothetical protein